MGLSTSPASVPSVTEREAVLRERAAVDLAVVEIMRRLRSAALTFDGGGTPRGRCETPNSVIVRRFVESLDFRDVPKAVCAPLPKITRPRRGTFSNGTVAWWETGSDNFRPSIDPHIEYEWGWDSIEGFIRAHVSTPVDVQILARMLSGETETVEDEEPSLDHPHERHGVDQ